MTMCFSKYLLLPLNFSEYLNYCVRILYQIKRYALFKFFQLVKLSFFQWNQFYPFQFFFLVHTKLLSPCSDWFNNSTISNTLETKDSYQKIMFKQLLFHKSLCRVWNLLPILIAKLLIIIEQISHLIVDNHFVFLW